MQRDRHAILTGAALELPCAADTAHEADARIEPRVLDTQHRIEKRALEQRSVERVGGVGGVGGGAELLASGEKVPRPRGKEAEATAALGLNG